MKLYHFDSPDNYKYAQATRRGTWYPQKSKICPECFTARQKRVSPLLIEWEPGSDMIGDFVWPAFNDDLVVSQRVREFFQDRFSGIEFGAVEFWQEKKLKQPKKMTCRSKPRVWLPYSGPQLWDLIPTSWCHLDHPKSNVTITKACSTCGKILYRVPTAPHRYLVVDLSTWEGYDIFRIYENSGLIFCTEQVKEIVEQAGFTNVGFFEDGILPD